MPSAVDDVATAVIATARARRPSRRRRVLARDALLPVILLGPRMKGNRHAVLRALESQPLGRRMCGVELGEVVEDRPGELVDEILGEAASGDQHRPDRRREYLALL